jgi:hypothetical protein
MILTHAASGTIATKAFGHQASKHTELGKTWAGRKNPTTEILEKTQKSQPKIPKIPTH